MEAVKLLFLIVLVPLVSSCRQVAVEYRIDTKKHVRQRLGTLDKRADHALYVLNDHRFEYDLRPIGNALIYSGDQSARTLPPGDSISSFIVFKPGPSSGAAHKTRFGGAIARLKKLATVEKLKSEMRPGGAGATLLLRGGQFSAVAFREVNERRWVVSSVFKDPAKHVIQAEMWAAVVDDFLVTFWMHVDDLAPMDAPLRNAEAARLRELVRGFRFSP